MTDTRTVDELWADAQRSLDTHVKLAELAPDQLREYVARDFGGYAAVPLLSVALVALASHPTTVDRVDAGVRDDLAYLWNLTRDWLNRGAASTVNVAEVTFHALCIHIPAKYGPGLADSLLVGALLALTAMRDV